MVYKKFELETDETDRLSRLPDGNIKEGRSLFSDANHERGKKLVSLTFGIFSNFLI